MDSSQQPDPESELTSVDYLIIAANDVAEDPNRFSCCAICPEFARAEEPEAWEARRLYERLFREIKYFTVEILLGNHDEVEKATLHGPAKEVRLLMLALAITLAEEGDLVEITKLED